MRHERDHDPITSEVWRSCAVCYAARSATFATFSEEAPGLGPSDWDEMIRRMQKIAARKIELVEGDHL